ncbi:periplasmic polysulfide reductase anchor subunit PsrC [Wolinella succinogenes]|uniref:Polysulfide reductase chain C n=1 Tax=Wolinella succinogenes (strain ATCC 29543 / DSM 1740 / CCUG 13145 / JCM 31913 / LMG 7466 / NCTC 11488 / FDC 602W) TaxID=273121 RepID=PSRC_WOLSU|nr:periplasmic polysulfide reductase anchor subunit PsrC [Wolinella succinogenes]P31077.1 RecName: Full=Polysulfide reductase chain C; AltName: Full=Sulfur reductase chain C [Wolinella succinogenes DSM 1740]HCZ19645.1 polysulfide reductase chain C [Helicobacter sp.]CAA46178.1 psrC [Wolinella succinogenes]CAE09283.1 NRFD [Wolinella succinogenes]VEG81496.1 tetrathionate reductase subunit C [Wolinella succinogenes]
MNQMWGSIEQYNTVVWHWPIAVYLFLAGLSAGAIISAIIIKWMKGNESSPWDGIIKAGALIAPLTIGAGLLLLIFDLTRPLHFWKLLIFYNFSSVMTLGVLALFAYFPVVLIFLLGVFKKELCDEGPFGFLAPLANIAYSMARPLEIVTFVLAIGVGAYTGFLLSAMYSYPLLNTPILPLLFLASGISAGISGNLLIGLLFFGKSTKGENVGYLHGLDFKVILFEAFLLFILFVGMYYQGGSTAEVAKAALTTGGLASLFWLGVAGMGLALPVVLNVALPHGIKHSSGFVMLNALIVLAGVMALRFYILYAGQTFVG